MPTFLKGVKRLLDAGSIGLQYYSSTPESGDIYDIDFRFGKPSKGIMPLYLIADGRQMFICNICDSYPAFGNILSWMERAMDPSSSGTKKLEALSLDSACSITTFFTVQIADDGPDGVSLLTIIRLNRSTPVFTCFCRTQDTILNMYKALNRAVREYSCVLDHPGNWNIFSGRGLPTTKISSIIRSQIQSDFLDSFLY